jgi:hypothetical protein
VAVVIVGIAVSHSLALMCAALSGRISLSSSSRCRLIASCSSARMGARIDSGRDVFAAAAISGSICACWALSRSSAGEATGARTRRVGHNQLSSSEWWWCNTLNVTAIWSSISAWRPTSRGSRAASASRPYSRRMHLWARRKPVKSISVMVGLFLWCQISRISVPRCANTVGVGR